MTDDYTTNLQKTQTLENLKKMILHESKNVASFVAIGQTLHKLYYEDKLVKNQREFLEWTKKHLGFSKSTTYEYIISYRVYSDIQAALPRHYQPPMYQAHCQLLAKVPAEELPGVWMKVSDMAPNGVITTALLESFLQDSFNIQQRRKKRSPVKPTATPTASSAAILTATPAKSLPRTQAKTFKRPRSNNLSEDEDSDTSEWAMSHTPLKQSKIAETPRSRTPPEVHRSSLKVPFDPAQIYELAQMVVNGQDFDKVCRSVTEFEALEQETWYGRLFCDLSACYPYSTNTYNPSPPSPHNSIERLLQIIFTRFATKEYSEGVFIIRAEFGADWFTPILSHPFCILRHMELCQGVDGFHSYIVFYMGPNVQEFRLQFRSVGLVPGDNCWSCQSEPISPSKLGQLMRREKPEGQREGDQEGFGSEFLNDHHIAVPMEDLNTAASVLCHMGVDE